MLTILFTFFISLLYAQHMRPPLVVDFLNDRVVENNVNAKPSCRNGYGGIFNESLCTRNEHQCQIKNRFYSKDRTALEVRIPKELSAHLGPYPGYLEILLEENEPINATYDKDHFQTSYDKLVPKKVEVNLQIKKTYPNQVEIIKLGKHAVPENGKIDVTVYERPKTKIRFEKSHDWKENESFSISEKQPFGYINGNAFEIFTSPSRYNFQFNYYDHETRTPYSLKINVELKDKNETIVIHKGMFRPTTTSETKAWSLEWSPSSVGTETVSQDYFSLRMQSTNEERLLFKINQIQLITQKETKNIIAMANIHLMGFSIEESKSDEFNKLIKNLPYFEIRIDGLCETAAYKPSSAMYPIFDTPSDKGNKIGLINVSLAPNHSEPVAYFESIDGTKKIIFKSNFAQENCHPPLMLHLVKDKKGNFSNLGLGPWGQDAWINLPTKNPLTSPEMKLGFFRNEETLQVTQVGEKYEIIRDSSDTEPTKEILGLDDFYEGNKFLPAYRCR
jgi:hypothetical protein